MCLLSVWVRARSLTRSTFRNGIAITAVTYSLTRKVKLFLMKYLLFFASSSLLPLFVSHILHFCRASFIFVSSTCSHSSTISRLLLTTRFFRFVPCRLCVCLCVFSARIFGSHFSCSELQLCTHPFPPAPQPSFLHHFATTNNKACICKYSGWFSSCKTILKVFSVIYFVFCAHIRHLHFTILSSQSPFPPVRAVSTSTVFRREGGGFFSLYRLVLYAIIIAFARFRFTLLISISERVSGCF